jgi:hypothetical protein
MPKGSSVGGFWEGKTSLQTRVIPNSPLLSTGNRGVIHKLRLGCVVSLLD